MVRLLRGLRLEGEMSEWKEYRARFGVRARALAADSAITTRNGVMHGKQGDYVVVPLVPRDEYVGVGRTIVSKEAFEAVYEETDPAPAEPPKDRARFEKVEGATFNDLGENHVSYLAWLLASGKDEPPDYKAGQVRYILRTCGLIHPNDTQTDEEVLRNLVPWDAIDKAMAG